MKYTLDTNIIVDGSIEDSKCDRLLKRFLNDVRFNKCFLTPQVKRELGYLLARISLLLQQIKDLIKKGNNPKQAYAELKNIFSPSFKKKLDNSFGSFIGYLEKQKDPVSNIDYFESKIISSFSRFTNRTIKVEPTEENLRKNYKTVKGLKKDCIDSKLVNDGDDAQIIAELIFLHRISSEIFELYTNNVKDYNSPTDIWKKKCGFISVKKP